MVLFLEQMTEVVDPPDQWTAALDRIGKEPIVEIEKVLLPRPGFGPISVEVPITQEKAEIEADLEINSAARIGIVISRFLKEIEERIAMTHLLVEVESMVIMIVDTMKEERRQLSPTIMIEVEEGDRGIVISTELSII